MIRIGILGSDNSHALAFSMLCNIPDENGDYLYDDVRVTAIYGHDDDPEHTKKVAEEGKIELIAEKPEDFIGKVDAVMVVTRSGALHVPLILPFVEAGYPVWLDKPVASSIEDVKKLKEACERNKTLITGGSTLKYNYDILALKNRINNKAFGTLLGGAMNFPGDLESKYEGLFFYGSHLVEMMLSVFGYDVKSVYATSVKSSRIGVLAKYNDFTVSLSYLAEAKEYLLTVYGSEKSYTIPMDMAVIYKLGFAKFIEMLKTKRMPLSFDDLVKPVYVIDAILKSIKENREVEIEC